MHRLNQSMTAAVLAMALAVGVGPFGLAAAENAGSVIYLVRHAETEPDDSADPPLSAAGRARAAALAETLADAGLVSIHSTDFARTRETARAAAGDLEIEVYDPSDPAALQALFEGLRGTPGGHLVVGHSNTVPAMVEALGGDSVDPIAHDEYDRLYVLGLGGAGVSSVLLHYGEPDGVPPASAAVPGWPIAERLEEGCLTYSMSFDGERVGSSAFETRLDADGWLFTETSHIERFQVDAVNRVRVGRDLRPRAFHASGSMFGNSVEIEVAFEDSRVTGTSMFPRQGGPETLHIDAEVPANTLERTSVFFVAPALPFEDGAMLRLHWFTTYSGELKRIVAAVIDREEVETPLGAYATWKVDLRGGASGQVLWVTREAPYRIVRIEVVGQPWTYELEEVTGTCDG